MSIIQKTNTIFDKTFILMPIMVLCGCYMYISPLSLRALHQLSWNAVIGKFILNLGGGAFFLYKNCFTVFKLFIHFLFLTCISSYLFLIAYIFNVWDTNVLNNSHDVCFVRHFKTILSINSLNHTHKKWILDVDYQVLRLTTPEIIRWYKILFCLLKNKRKALNWRCKIL